MPRPMRSGTDGTVGAGLTGRHRWRKLLAAALLLGAAGCQTHYERLRLRPVDTTTQLTLAGVRVSVATRDAAPVELGVTDEHGQIEIAHLRAGQTITLQLDGYEPAILLLRPGGYGQKSPMTLREWTNFPLAEGETIPVPLHRVGNVRRPAEERR